MGKLVQHSKSGRGPAVVRKNISKKQAEKNQREKAHYKLQRQSQRDAKKKQNFQLRQMQKNQKSGVTERRLLAQKQLEAKRTGKEDEIWEDVDEHEKDVFDKDGYFDVMDHEAQISQADLNLLAKFEQTNRAKKQVSFGGPAEGEGKNLADIIMAKMAAGDFQTDEDLAKTDDILLD